MQNAPDPYRTLGVVRGATEGQIKSAHRALAKRYHPDAPTGDTVRFLLVQEAYQLLSDPLRRREWDARHAPGPMRAGQAAPPRPRAPNGRWTRAEAAPPGRAASARGGTPAGGEATGATGPAGGRPPRAPGRDPATRSYTWSASEVPWWEDHGPRDSRRQPGRRRPHEEQPSPAGSPDPAVRPATPDFDVYNRSSGAAWSSAARAYFRRAEADLPRRGSFHRQGTQPLTAARARVAAEEDARRAGMEPPSPSTRPSRNPARPATQPSPAGSAPAGSAPAGSAPAGPAGPSAANTDPPPRPAAPAAAAQASGPAAPVRPSTTAAGPPAHARAGVAHDAQTISTARSALREAARAARWPSVPERLLYALVAWLPVALLIGYAGSAVTGCDRAAVSCPAYFETLQTVLIALALGILVALPRVAYTAALATVAIIVTGIGVVIATWLVGLRQPLSGPVLTVASVLLLIAYLATAGWLLSDGRRGRPWAADRRTRRGIDR